uniref:Uncharacterized protein n=1 Tax=Rhizophora mucronata TaxID=61149 RepID=A0A2P2MAH7_RHIMU
MKWYDRKHLILKNENRRIRDILIFMRHKTCTKFFIFISFKMHSHQIFLSDNALNGHSQGYLK